MLGQLWQLILVLSFGHKIFIGKCLGPKRKCFFFFFFFLNELSLIYISYPKSCTNYFQIWSCHKYFLNCAVGPYSIFPPMLGGRRQIKITTNLGFWAKLGGWEGQYLNMPKRVLELLQNKDMTFV